MTPYLQILAFIGETLSGLAAALAVALAILAIKKTIPHEVDKFRATKREEKRAEVAQTVWMAVFRLVLALRGMTNPANEGTTDTDEHGIPKKEGRKFLESYSDRYKISVEASNGFLDSWGLATLFLDKPITDGLNRLWKTRGDIFTNFRLHAVNLDATAPHVPFPDAHQALFGRATVEEINQCESELRALLEPVARFVSEAAIRKAK